MSSNWGSVLNEINDYLADFESETTKVLENINEVLLQSEQKFDDRIRKHFVKSVNSRLEQTFEFFEIQNGSQVSDKKPTKETQKISEKEEKNPSKEVENSEAIEQNCVVEEKIESTPIPRAIEPEQFSREIELEKQRKKYNNLRIIGIAKITSDKLLAEIFLHICDAIGVTNVSFDNINNICRRSGAIIVELNSRELKANILKAWRSTSQKNRQINLQSLNSVRPRINPSKISFQNDLTQFFVKLSKLAEKAKESKQISSCYITDDGLKVRSMGNDNKTAIIFTKNELEKFIQGSL